MTDDETRPRRLYDEREISRILERATELQKEDPPAGGGAGGLALSELEEIAREAGIDPRHLRRAARELDTTVGGGGEWDRLVGAPLALVLERTFPGEIADTDFEALVFEIQRRADTHGQPSLMGRTLTWQAETQSKSRTLQVVVTSRAGETTIRIEERLHQYASGLFGGTVGGFGVGLGVAGGMGFGLAALGSPLFAVAFPVGVASVAFIGARAVYRNVVGRRRRVLQDMMEGLTELVEEAIEEGLEPPSASRELPAGGPAGGG